MKPHDFSKGLEMFWEFHQLEPVKAGEFNRGFKIPSEIACVGDGLWITYASTKWTGKRENYIHDHEQGVKYYRPDVKENKRSTIITAHKAKTLVRLGDCLGFSYKDKDGKEVEASVKRPYPELYCTPDGSVLLVIEGKRKLLAMAWGGHLDVKQKGICG